MGKTLTEAVSALADAWASDTLADVGPSLTCDEAEALAEVFRVAGMPTIADEVIAAHAEGDDEGDAHHAGETETETDEGIAR